MTDYPGLQPHQITCDRLLFCPPRNDTKLFNAITHALERPLDLD